MEHPRPRQPPRIVAMGESARSIVIGLTALATLAGSGDPTQQVEERVTVERVVIDAHVIDRFSVPIQGLTVQDFVVKVDGRVVPLESVEWVGASTAQNPTTASEHSASAENPSEATTEPTPEPEGRLFVMLFQWEVASQKAIGFIRMQRLAKELVGRMNPRDRVAVLLFDSRLRLRRDFTEDKTQLADDLEQVLSHEEDRNSDGSGSMLARQLNLDDARDATSPEKAMEVLGRALESIPGKKSLLFFGSQMENWYGKTTIHYELARRNLQEAETSVFCLDTSDGRHKLSRNLVQIAKDTGGLYIETFDFPLMALQSIDRVLSGYYVLVFRNPPGPRGQHEIVIKLAGRPGTVAHRRFYEDYD